MHDVHCTLPKIYVIISQAQRCMENSSSCKHNFRNIVFIYVYRSCSQYEHDRDKSRGNKRKKKRRTSTIKIKLCNYTRHWCCVRRWGAFVCDCSLFWRETRTYASVGIAIAFHRATPLWVAPKMDESFFLEGWNMVGRETNMKSTSSPFSCHSNFQTEWEKERFCALAFITL